MSLNFQKFIRFELVCRIIQLFFPLYTEQIFAYNITKQMFEVRIMLEHYIGRTVEIIYEDRNGEITQRRIVVRSVRDDVVHATCLTAKAWRPFRLERILSWQPVKGRTA